MRERIHTKHRGFTLVELMVVAVIAGIIAAIAIPAYTKYMMKSRRADAINTLSAAVQAQERYRSNSSIYQSDPTQLGLPNCPPASASCLSNGGLYNISVNDLNPAVQFVSGYEVHAQAASAPQTGDTDCSDMFISMKSGNLTYGSTTTTTPAVCWPQ